MKKMTLSSLALLSVLAFVGCSSDGNMPTPSTTTTTTTEESTSSAMPTPQAPPPGTTTTTESTETHSVSQ
jgi:PBP1b-binding outer membrane lipoprotein LpoB